MKTIKRQVSLKPTLLTQLNGWLAQHTAVAGYKETAVLYSLPVCFAKNPEGNIEADIKVCNGDTGPYIDAVLFCDGNEQAVLEPSFEQFEGTYIFHYAGNKYQVTIREAQPVQPKCSGCKYILGDGTACNDCVDNSNFVRMTITDRRLLAKARKSLQPL